MSKSRGCLGFLFELFGDRGNAQPSQQKMPAVRLNKYFVSDAEADFFRVLKRVVGDKGHVLAQVSLRQLLWFPGNNTTNPGRQVWDNKVARKTVDFVVCNPSTLQPLVVIELDEPTHGRPERQTRDEEVSTILEAANIALIRVLTSRMYDFRELQSALFEYVH